MLRGVERHHANRTIPDKRGGAVKRKRVVEVRRVYAELFRLS
jgi:hypothetical protein